MLRRYDADDSGRIDLAEFAALVRELQLLVSFDKDGDGVSEAFGKRSKRGKCGKCGTAWQARQA